MFKYSEKYYKVIDSLPIYYDFDKRIDLSILKDLIRKDKNNFIKNFIIVQEHIHDDLFSLKSEKEKSIYFDKIEHNLCSLLDEKIKEEWIWYFVNDNKKYTEEFNKTLDELEKENNYSLDQSYQIVMDWYRKRYLKEKNITNPWQVLKLMEPRKRIEWRRKYQFQWKKDIISFYGRNSVINFLTYWNYKEWFQIISTWGNYSSSQLEDHISCAELIYEIKQNKNDNSFIWTEIMLYNEYNKLQKIKEVSNEYVIFESSLHHKSKIDLTSNFISLKEIVYEYQHFWFVADMINKLDRIKTTQDNDFVKTEIKALKKFYLNWNSLKLKEQTPFYSSPMKLFLPKNKKEWLLYINYQENTEESIKRIILYFWDISNSYWDDLNDNPASLNSWEPYNEFTTMKIIINLENNLFEYGIYFDTKEYDFIKDKKEIIWTLNWKKLCYWTEFNKIFKYIKSMDYTIIY